MEEVYVIYGITDCPACLRAQADLMDLDLEYVFIQTDFSKAYRQSVRDEFKWSTFPIILLINKNGETLIGGYEELSLHLEPGAPSSSPDCS
jgi:glutaredoxin